MIEPIKINLPTIDVEETIKAAADSETLIKELVENGNHSEQIHNTIKRNIEHLNIILGRDEIIASKSPKLASFKEVVKLGEAFIAAE